MSANILPPADYLSSESRTTSDMQAAFENANSVGKELMGGASEGATLSIVSNVITPVNDACVFPVDAAGGGTVNLINVGDIRDGQVIAVHSVSSSNPITFTNMATATGGNIPIATFSGSNIVLTNPAQFLQLKYTASLALFQEFNTPSNGGSTDWGSPGAIGSVAPNTGAFTSVTISSPLDVSSGGTGTNGFAVHNLLVGEGSSISVITPSSTSGYPLVSQGISADPSFAQLNLSSAVTGVLSVANGGTALSASGTANQVLGVQTSGTGLEYKSIIAGSGVTVTSSAGQIQISSTGGGSASFPLANQCRLYLISGNPYEDTDTTSPPMGSQTLFFGPCPDKGNSIFLYNSTTSSWGRVAATETSKSLSTLTAGNTYDVYAYNNSGSVALEFSTAWSGDTPPTRDIDSQAGVYVKHGDSTRLYVGTIEVYLNTASTPQLSVASYPGYRGLWNAYNRIQSTVSAFDSSAADWSATGSWRIAHGLTDTAYGSAVIRIVTGAQIEAVSLNRYVRVQPDSYTASASFGIAKDSGSSTPLPVVIGVVFATSYTDAGVVTSSVPYTASQIGAHVFESVEITSGGANFYSYEEIGSTKIPTAGMSGTTWC